MTVREKQKGILRELSNWIVSQGGRVEDWGEGGRVHLSIPNRGTYEYQRSTMDVCMDRFDPQSTQVFETVIQHYVNQLRGVYNI